MTNINSEVDYVVDINPYKRNTYIAGTGHKVVIPEDLPDLNPDVIIIMNPIYKNEIQAKLDELGITAKLLTV